MILILILILYFVIYIYSAFSTVVADGQFSTLGTVLLAALAQTKKIILPLPQSENFEVSDPTIRPLSISMTAKREDADNDFGTPIRRVVEDAVQPPSTAKQQNAESSHGLDKLESSSGEVRKVKKSKTKKKKSANAIDDIFSALK